MGVLSIYKVRVRKSYTCEVEVSAESETDAYVVARNIPGVVMIEAVHLADEEV